MSTRGKKKSASKTNSKKSSRQKPDRSISQDRLKQSSLSDFISSSNDSKTDKKHRGNNRLKAQCLDSTFVDCDGWIETDKKKITENLQHAPTFTPKISTESMCSKPNDSKLFNSFGIKSPCFENILLKKQDLEQQIEKLDNVYFKEHSSVAKHVDEFFDVKDCMNHIGILNCKHLSLPEIVNAFNTNLRYVTNIFNEKYQHNSHTLFDNIKSRECIIDTSESFALATSMTAFNYEQKRQLLKLLREIFCDSTPVNLTSLLSEVCLKIFMDVHSLSFKQATEYLNNNPIESSDT